MSTPDPVATGIVIAGALQLAKQAQDFIAAASGHPGETLGEIFGGWSRRRVQNVEAVGNKARLILLNLGVEPQPVLLKVIQPLLEAASLEEEPDIQEMWARLLAGATSAGTLFLPSFIDILRQLTTEEARFLKALSELVDKEIAIFNPSKNHPHPRDYIGNSEQFTEMFHEANGIPLDGNIYKMSAFAIMAFENICRLGIISPTDRKDYYKMTFFGMLFLSTIHDQKSVEPTEKS
jgi:hypothetical protein